MLRPDLSPPSRVLQVLASAAGALHGEPDEERLRRWAVDAIAELTGLSDVALCSIPRDGSPTWLSNRSAELRFAVIGDPRLAPTVAAALRDEQPLFIEDLADHISSAGGARLAALLPCKAVLVVPVPAADGRPHGAVFIAAASSDLLDADVFSAVRALAAHMGVALDNHAALAHLAELEARGKEVVHQLQEAVRTPAPVVAHTELGVHYVAADPSAPTGGDLYDWIVLPDGDVHFTVVDVMGKGVEATKHALAVTHTLRVLAVDGCPLGEVVGRTDQLVTAQNPDLVATLQVGRYSPTTGRVMLAGGGHPPALLVRGDTVQEIAAPGIPIGWPGAGSHGVVELCLGRSDSLILYTDGLIEATKDILQGLADLAAAALATASYPATSMARALVERQLANAARHDDSLALVLRRRTPPPSGAEGLLGPLTHRFSPSTAAVPLARHLLADWLERVPVEASAVDGLLLVASELCSNAVRHSSGAPGSVQLRAWTEDGGVVLEVEDDGGALTWSAPVLDEVPDPEAETGRGLFLVTELSDAVATRTVEGRTVVRSVKRAVVGVRP